MTDVRALTLVIAALFVLSTAATALAQGGTTATPTAPAGTKTETKTEAAKTEVKSDTQTDTKDGKTTKKADKKAQKQAAKDKRKADKKAAKATEDGQDETGKGKSNKGGKLRGLDRADQVAGEHGKQGRDNARAKQGR